MARRRFVPVRELAKHPVPAYVVWLDHTTLGGGPWVVRGESFKKDAARDGAAEVRSCCYVVEEHDESLVVSHSVSVDNDDPKAPRWEHVEPFLIAKRAVVEFRRLDKRRAVE